MKKLILALALAPTLVFGGEVLTGDAVANNFRVTPYVQHPTTNAMSLLWLTTTNTEATLTVSSPLAGFYYSLRQNAMLTALDFSDKNKLGGKDEITFTLDRSKSSGFYQMIVTPKAVE